MSGVGSTNAMKKGSANNPFLANSEADMQGFLNSAYTGCIVKYTGPAINRTLSEQNKTVPEYAQNLVFNRVNYGWPYFYDGNVKFIVTEKTNEGTNTWYLVAGKYINGAWDFSRNGAFNGDVVLTNSLGANPTSVRKLWTPKDKWNNDYINDQGNLTFWTYDEDVVFTIAPIDNNDIDYTDLTGITIVPYKVNELYKVVYSDGEYYYEEFCHISDTRTTANSDYIAPGKTAFDFTGNLQTGTGSKINPYIASTADEMTAYLTSSYKGAFVKYVGETVTVGGTPVPANPIAVGDTISKLYFDTTKEVDFSKFVYDQPFGDDIPTGVAILLSSQQNVNILTASDLSVAGMSGYVLMLMEKISQTSADVKQTILYASEALPDLGVSQAGWQSGTSLDLLQANTISIVNAQDVWGAYISKDGQWTSSGGESYVKNAIYQVAEDGDTTRYAILPTLSNPADPVDVAEGKEVINQLGAVMIGTGNNVLQASTTEGMQALFIDANIGKIAKYVGETDVYIKDAFYLITSDENTKQYYELPALANEGTADDLVLGKELINSKGEKVVGLVDLGDIQGKLFYGSVTYNTAVNGVDLSIPGLTKLPKFVLFMSNASYGDSKNDVYTVVYPVPYNNNHERSYYLARGNYGSQNPVTFDENTKRLHIRTGNYDIHGTWYYYIIE